MNYVVLQEGESMFLGPNVPHAYIFGGMFHQSKHGLVHLCATNADGKGNVCVCVCPPNVHTHTHTLYNNISRLRVTAELSFN